MWITLIFGLQKAFIICSRSTPRRVATFFPAVFSLSSGSHCSSLPFCLNFYNFKIWIYLYSNLERVNYKKEALWYIIWLPFLPCALHRRQSYRCSTFPLQRNVRCGKRHGRILDLHYHQLTGQLFFPGWHNDSRRYRQKVGTSF